MEEGRGVRENEITFNGISKHLYCNAAEHLQCICIELNQGVAHDKF